MTIEQLINQLTEAPQEFSQVMEVIDNYYEFTPTAFKNGELQNEANQNNGSCKVFSFAKLHNLDQQATLNAFGKFYTEDVLQHPENDDHQNIRNFIKFGWQGIEFEEESLIEK